MEAAEKSLMTITEYLAMEEMAEIKHDYSAGEIVAMTGGTLDHGRIISNIDRFMAPTASANGCEVFTNDIRLAVRASDMFTYPDLMLVCGEIERFEDRLDTITNPRLIIEVLSSSTRDYDSGRKLHAYRKLPSLEEYLMVDQYSFAVDRFCRRGKFWQLEDLHGLEAVLTIDHLDIEIPFSTIYANTDLLRSTSDQ